MSQRETWLRLAGPISCLPIRDVEDLWEARDWLIRDSDATVLVDPIGGTLLATTPDMKLTLRVGQRLVFDVNSRAFDAKDDDPDFHALHRKMGFA